MTQTALANDNPLSNADLFDCIKRQDRKRLEEWAGAFKLNPTVADKNGISPLHLAATCSVSTFLELFLLNGSDANARDVGGRTPLMVAAVKGVASSLQAILLSDGEIHQKDNRGRTALSYASGHGQEEALSYLLRSGAKLEWCDNNQNNALAYAMMRKQESCALFILRYIANPNSPLLEFKNKTDQNPLHLAAAFNLIEVARFLIRSHVILDPTDGRQRTPLMIAAVLGHKEIVDLLLQAGADSTLQDENGNTALMYATALGEAETVAALVEDEKSLQIKNANDITPLMLASAPGSFDEEVQKIRAGAEDLFNQEIQNVDGDGADLFDLTKTTVEGSLDEPTSEAKIVVKGKSGDLVDQKKITIKSTVPKAGYRDVVRKIASKQKFLNETDSRRRTALHLAAENNDHETVEILLSASADHALLDDKNETALVKATLAGNEELVSVLAGHGCEYREEDLKRPEIRKVHEKLKNEGRFAKREEKKKEIDINARVENGQTPLIQATLQGDLKKVEDLIAEGANVNGKDFNGYTSLMYAAIGGSVELVEFFIRQKATVDTKNTDGWTALALAVYAGKTKILRRLIDAGANPEFRVKGMTLLMLAAKKGFQDVVQILLLRGADANARDYKKQSAADYARKAGHVKIAEFIEAKLGSAKESKEGAVQQQPARTARKARW